MGKPALFSSVLNALVTSAFCAALLSCGGGGDNSAATPGSGASPSPSATGSGTGTGTGTGSATGTGTGGSSGTGTGTGSGPGTGTGTGGTGGQTAASWTIVDLGSLGGPYSYAQALNDSGQVVGSSATTANDYSRYHAFLYSNGQMQDIAAPPAGVSSAASINKAGQVVGRTQGSSGEVNFLYSNGVLTQLASINDYSVLDINGNGVILASGLNCLSCAILISNGTVNRLQDFQLDKAQQALPVALNDKGQIAGMSRVSSEATSPQRSAFRAFIYTSGAVTDLGELAVDEPPPLTGTLPNDINSRGEVVGSSKKVAFLYKDGSMQRIGPAGAYSYARGINEASQVVGTVVSADSSTEYAFLYSGGTLTNLNNLSEVKAAGWDLREAIAINNVGQITGRGRNASGQEHAFLLTPK